MVNFSYCHGEGGNVRGGVSQELWWEIQLIGCHKWQWWKNFSRYSGLGITFHGFRCAWIINTMGMAKTLWK